MPFVVPIERARTEYPDYSFVSALTPSEQKAAFHLRDSEGRDLCLKIISPSYAVDRLTREIEAPQSIDHPGVVRLLEYTFSARPGNHRHILVEEFVEGTDLAASLTGQPWEVERTTPLLLWPRIGS